MSVFPKKESEIVELVETMIAGYTAHADDFPSCAPAALQVMLDDYKEQRDAQTSAQSQTITATEGKNTALEVLITSMRDSLKRAETDTTADPSKLYEIGWGPKQQPQPVPLPGAPTLLHSVAEGQATITMAWTRPGSGSGGPVRNYIVERCQQVQTGGYGPWTIAGSTYNCEITLKDQPVDAKLQFRVKASNTTGEGGESNSISVTLP